MLLDDASELIKAIKTNNHYELSDWEEGFIQSIENQISMNVKLTAKQEAKLRDIYRTAYNDPT